MWGTECLNTWFPLPTLQNMRYERVKLFMLSTCPVKCSKYLNYKKTLEKIFDSISINEVSRGAGAQACDCKTALSSATQHAMPPKLDEKWGAEAS